MSTNLMNSFEDCRTCFRSTRHPRRTTKNSGNLFLSVEVKYNYKSTLKLFVLFLQQCNDRVSQCYCFQNQYEVFTTLLRSDHCQSMPSKLYCLILHVISSPYSCFTFIFLFYSVLYFLFHTASTRIAPSSRCRSTLISHNGGNRLKFIIDSNGLSRIMVQRDVR